MRIESSAVAMQSEHIYSVYAEHKSATLVTNSDDAAILDFSDESKSLVEQMKENEKALLQHQREKQQENSARGLKTFVGGLKSQSSNLQLGQPMDMKSLQIETLKKILEALNKMNGKKIHGTQSKSNHQETQSAQSWDAGGSATSTAAQGIFGGAGISGTADTSGANGVSTTGAVSAGNSTMWVRTSVESAFVSEMEQTAFQAQGIANTADGRQISFGVSVEMSRAFTAKYESFSQEAYIVTDPLVINLDSSTATVTDQKFMFDLDSDGKEDEISFAGKGSGFLALDKNNDGKISDGRELFGTQSGDGFKDLAQYDSDGDGWIDEDDTIFQDLKVWMKDDDGQDILLSLKEANVGAIYLGKAETEFSLKDESNQTNALIRSSGVYLKETGEVGTVQHVDLVL